MLLITNDDGIEALGLCRLINSLDTAYPLSVIAPALEQSAASHALSLRDPVKAQVRTNGQVAVWGTPADCVYLGLHHFFKGEGIDMVVSGINKGTNLGSDVHYSGTVAAAKEGALSGLLSLAISLDHSPHGAVNTGAHWDTAAQVGVRVVERLLALSSPKILLWNLNVPDRPYSEIRGLKLCRLGKRFYSSGVEITEASHYRLGGAHQRFCETPGTDGFWFSQGYATLTPLSLSWSNGTDGAVDESGRLELEAPFN